jgi:carbon monoxide dehydrogenase subunit G
MIVAGPVAVDWPERERERERRSTMAIVQRNVQIKASPQETMALLSDASRWPDWYPGMMEINIAAPFPDKGGKVAFKVKSVGVSLPITETVLDYQPGKLQLFQMEGMLSGRARWELTPEGDGTRLTTTFDYALPGGVLGKLADALIVRRVNGKSLAEALNNFKALVERR